MLDSKLYFLPASMQGIIQKLTFIDTFKGRWSGIEKMGSRQLRELRRIATIQSIGSSTRIEGATLSDEEVRKLLGKVRITKLETRDGQEVVGYFEVLDLILEHHAEIGLGENFIKQLHGMLLKHSDKDERHRGAYKSLPNTVVANYPDGSQRTIFRTTEPHLTPDEMQGLVSWTGATLAAGKIHPLLVIGLFVYEFLSIHPFQDGNGRLSRLLTTLLSLKNGYGFVQYVSFEHIIEQRKDEYYRALMSGQQNRHTDAERIDAWMIFFLECLETLVRRLDAKYAELQARATYLNPRQEEVMRFFGEGKRAKLGDVATQFSAVPLPTLRKDLAYLVAEGLLERTGQGKGTVYFGKLQQD